MSRTFFKSFVVVFLSTIWITGIIAPPVLQLIDDNAVLISLNMNEEEPQEQGKKDIGEEFILGNPMSVNDFLLFSYSDSAGDSASSFSNSYYGEIQLPPPEGLL
ncbi:hypothetical protein AB8P51_06905 [Muriicola sp. SD30]|uniref:hypothetical protein n=1 Tax=Muriicola sp. SD30 TaxID=3240936 RepID=UPI00350F7B53